MEGSSGWHRSGNDRTALPLGRPELTLAPAARCAGRGLGGFDLSRSRLPHKEHHRRRLLRIGKARLDQSQLDRKRLHDVGLTKDRENPLRTQGAAPCGVRKSWY